MTSSEWDRSRRRARAVAALTVLAVLAAVVTMFATVGVPEAWWPQIGWAFAASPQPNAPTASADPCARITGAAHDSCAPSPAPSSGAKASGVGAADAFRLAAPAAGLILVFAVRRSGRRRR